jgi:hypothetical protein
LLLFSVFLTCFSTATSIASFESNQTSAANPVDSDCDPRLRLGKAE